MRRSLPYVAILALCTAAVGAAEPAVRITILNDNSITRPRVKASWGFACLVEAHGKTVLFDTGGDPAVLRDNLAALKVDASRIEAVVISHFHGDHTFGAPGAGVKNGLPVYTPRSFERYSEVHGALARAGLSPVPLSAPRTILEGFSISAPLSFPNGMASGAGEAVDAVAWEEALVVDTPPGLVVIVGCSHPGILAMVEQLKGSSARPIHMVLGGFHLLQKSLAEVEGIAMSMRSLGVARAGPTHCSGDDALYAFRKVYGDSFVRAGVGSVIEVAGAH